MHEIQRTSNFRAQYQKLELRFRRFVDEAMDVIKEFPIDYQNKITHLGNKKDGGLYRFRIPGYYIIYVVPIHDPGSLTIVTMTNLQKL